MVTYHFYWLLFFSKQCLVENFNFWGITLRDCKQFCYVIGFSRIRWGFTFSALESRLYNNYSMSPISIWSDKITNERLARVGYNHFISNKGEWNNCLSKFSNQVLPSICISTIFQSGKFLNLAHYFPYDVKLRLLAHSRSFLANQKARNAIVGAENLLKRCLHSLPNSLYVWTDGSLIRREKVADSGLFGYV